MIDELEQVHSDLERRSKSISNSLAKTLTQIQNLTSPSLSPTSESDFTGLAPLFQSTIEDSPNSSTSSAPLPQPDESLPLNPPQPNPNQRPKRATKKPDRLTYPDWRK